MHHLESFRNQYLFSSTEHESFEVNSELDSESDIDRVKNILLALNDYFESQGSSTRLLQSFKPIQRFKPIQGSPIKLTKNIPDVGKYFQDFNCALENEVYTTGMTKLGSMEMRGVLDSYKIRLIIGEKIVNNGIRLIGKFNNKTSFLKFGVMLYPHGGISFGVFDEKNGHLKNGYKLVFPSDNEGQREPIMLIGSFDSNDNRHLLEGYMKRVPDTAWCHIECNEGEENSCSQRSTKDNFLPIKSIGLFENNASKFLEKIGSVDPETGWLRCGIIILKDHSLVMGTFCPSTGNLKNGIRINPTPIDLQTPQALNSPKIEIGDFDPITEILIDGYYVSFNDEGFLKKNREDIF